MLKLQLVFHFQFNLKFNYPEIRVFILKKISLGYWKPSKIYCTLWILQPCQVPYIFLGPSWRGQLFQFISSNLLLTLIFFQNTFNPNIQVGGASTLPASTGGISYSGAVKGATPPRGPLAQTYSTSSSGSSSPYNSPPGSPTAGRAGSAITFPSPNYSNALPRATGGATNQVGPIKIQPPFLNPIVEINIAVQGILKICLSRFIIF